MQTPSAHKAGRSHPRRDRASVPHRRDPRARGADSLPGPAPGRLVPRCPDHLRRDRRKLGLDRVHVRRAAREWRRPVRVTGSRSGTRRRSAALGPRDLLPERVVGRCQGECRWLDLGHVLQRLQRRAAGPGLRRRRLRRWQLVQRRRGLRVDLVELLERLLARDRPRIDPVQRRSVTEQDDIGNEPARRAGSSCDPGRSDYGVEIVVTSSVHEVLAALLYASPL